MTEDRDRTMTLPDGRVLGYAEWGDPSGPPVVYFHGVPASRLDPVCFPEAANEAGVRLISVDRPGMGLSTFQRSRKIAQWPADVTALADHLKLERFGVAGWSGGGPYVFACAAKLADRLTGAVSVAGVGPFDRPGAMDGMERQEGKLARLCLRAPPVARLVLGTVLRVSRARPDQALKSFRESVGDSDKRAIDAMPEEGRQMGWFIESGRQSAKGPVHDYRALGDWGFELSAVTTPVSVWQGDADKLVAAAHAEDLVARAPGATLHPCPGEGHLAMVTHAAEIFREASGRASTAAA